MILIRINKNIPEEGDYITTLDNKKYKVVCNDCEGVYKYLCMKPGKTETFYIYIKDDEFIEYIKLENTHDLYKYYLPGEIIVCSRINSTNDKQLVFSYLGEFQGISEKDDLLYLGFTYSLLYDMPFMKGRSRAIDTSDITIVIQGPTINESKFLKDKIKLWK